MDFWGVEVKRGEPCPIEPGEGKVVHLSQACLGEVKKHKGSDSIYLHVTVDGKKLVLGTLSPEKFPQQQFDLLFDKNFELSHNWKNGSVYFYGYRCNAPFDETEDSSEAESEDLPVIAADNGKFKSQAKLEKPPDAENANTAKPASAAAKQKVKIVEPKKDVKTVKEEDGSSEDGFDTDSSEYESDSDEDEDSDSESVEGETEDEDEDEETPKKVELSKKRPAESATEIPGPDKKAKFVTPQKTDTKKGGGHVATPHPSKQAGKSLANQSKQQTPKSSGSHPCKSCNRSFNSENALQSHTKAKHSAGK